MVEDVDPPVTLTLPKQVPFQPTKKLATYTALCIIPPWGLHGPIEDIRKIHDPAFERWMPHINYYFPFVAPEFFEDTHEKLTKILETFASFEVTLKNLDFFSNSTVWANPVAKPVGAAK